METELKSCPHCGMDVQYTYNIDLEPDGIMCPKCHTVMRFIRISVKPGEQFIIAMSKMAEIWNRRAE